MSAATPAGTQTEAQPPFVDEHALDVAAPAERAWYALARVLPKAFGGRGPEAFAGVVGCAHRRPAGVFPERGARIVGFEVTESAPPRRLVLEGRHRFSTYVLTFEVEPTGAGACRVRARTNAAFPGIHGALYETAVIRTRMHVLVTRRLLRAVKRRAERA